MRLDDILEAGPVDRRRGTEAVVDTGRSKLRPSTEWPDAMILVDGRCFYNPPSGFHRFGRSLLRALLREDDFDLRLITDGNPGYLGRWIQAPFRQWPDRVSKLAPAVYHDLTNGLDLSWILGLSNAPRVVVTVHDVIPLQFEATDEGYRRFQSTYRRTREQILPRADAIATVSQTSRSAIIDLFGIDANRISVIYPGLDPSFRPRSKRIARYAIRWLGIDEDGVILVSVAAPQRYKKPDTVIRALAELRTRFHSKRVQLVAVGHYQPDYAYYLHLLAQKLGVGNDVIFTGRISDTQLRHIYNAADLYVYPSMMEGFGFTPLEAMASGVPAIVSNKPIFHETLGDSAVFIDPESAVDVAEAIASLLLDDGRYERLRNSGIERSRAYTWRQAAILYRELYGKFA